MRIYTLAIALLICTNTQAQIIRAEPFYIAPEAAGAYSYLIDDYPGAAAAYSLRKLDNNYAGSAIRVRRKSDNTEQDIGFTNNYLDTTSLKTFVGTGATDTAWVVTWYNQADSSGVFGVRNLSQSTASNQPLIYAGGVFRTNDEGFINIESDGVNDVMANTTRIFTSDLSAFIVTDPKNLTTIPAGIVNQALTGDAGRLFLYGKRTNPTNMSGGFQIGSVFIEDTSLPSSVTSLHYYNRASNAMTYSIDGNAEKTGTSSNNITNTFLQAFATVRSGSTSEYTRQGVSEIICYSSSQSSNKSGITANINSFYSIY